MRVAIDQDRDQACPFVPLLPRALGLLPLPWPPLEIWTELCTLPSCLAWGPLPMGLRPGKGLPGQLGETPPWRLLFSLTQAGIPILRDKRKEVGKVFLATGSYNYIDMHVHVTGEALSLWARELLPSWPWGN